MAADTVIQFGASLIDEEGISASTVAHVFGDATQTVAQTKTALAAWAGAVDLVTGAKITGTRALILGPGVTNGAKPVAGSEVQETASFSFAVGATPYHWSLVVPAILETLTTSGEMIAPTGDVADLITLMLGAVLGGHYTGISTDTLTSYFRNFQGDRKHRKQLFRKSVNYTQPG